MQLSTSTSMKWLIHKREGQWNPDLTLHNDSHLLQNRTEYFIAPGLTKIVDTKPSEDLWVHTWMWINIPVLLVSYKAGRLVHNINTLTIPHRQMEHIRIELPTTVIQ